MRNTRKDSKKPAQYNVIILGIMISVAISLLGAALLAVFIHNEYLEITDTQHAAFIIQLLATFLGAFISGKLTTKNKIISYGMVIGGYFVFIVCCGTLLFDGLGSGIWSGVIAMIVGFIASFFLSAVEKKPTASKRRRIATR